MIFTTKSCRKYLDRKSSFAESLKFHPFIIVHGTGKRGDEAKTRDSQKLKKVNIAEKKVYQGEERRLSRSGHRAASHLQSTDK